MKKEEIHNVKNTYILFCFHTSTMWSKYKGNQQRVCKTGSLQWQTNNRNDISNNILPNILPQTQFGQIKGVGMTSIKIISSQMERTTMMITQLPYTAKQANITHVQYSTNRPQKKINVVTWNQFEDLKKIITRHIERQKLI